MYNEFSNYFKQSQPEPEAVQTQSQGTNASLGGANSGMKKESGIGDAHNMTRSPPGLRKPQPNYVSKKPKIGLKGYTTSQGPSHDLHSEKRTGNSQYLSPKAPLSKEALQEKLSRGKVGVAFPDQKTVYVGNRSVSPVFMFPTSNALRKQEPVKEELKKSLIGEIPNPTGKPPTVTPVFHFETPPPLPILQPKNLHLPLPHPSEDQETQSTISTGWPMPGGTSNLGSNRKVPLLTSLTSFADADALGPDSLSTMHSHPQSLAQFAVPKLALPDSHKRNGSALTPGISHNQPARDPNGPRNPLSKSVLSQASDGTRDYSSLVIAAVKANLVDKVLNLVTKPPPGAKFDPNFRGDNDWSAMHYACWVGNLTMVNLLFYNQVNINGEARNGITPAMVACSRGHSKLLKHMVALKVDLHQIDSTANNLFHYAAKSGSLECIKILLDARAPGLLDKNLEAKAPVDMAKTLESREYLVYSAARIEDLSTDRHIRICSVNNENFCVADRLTTRKTTSRSEETDCSSRSLETEEVGPKDFIIHALIGKGSFGEVFLVERRVTGVLYAMKVLYKSQISRSWLITQNKTS